MRFVCLLVGIFIGLLPARSSEAQSDGDTRARMHFQAGASYYEAGEYKDALREFQRAQELSGRPQLFYNFSLCYQNLDEDEKAVHYLARYLDEVEEIPNRANLERRLENMKERLEEREREQTQSAEPEDDTEAAKAPSATGTDSPTTSGGDETVSDDTATSTDPAPRQPRSRSDGESSRAPGGLESSTSSSRSDDGGGLPTISMVSFAAAAGGLAAMATFGGLAIAEKNSVASGCGKTQSCTQGQVSAMDTYALISDVGLGVAVLGGAVGLAWMFVSSGASGDSERAGLEVRPWVDPRGGGGAAIGGHL